MNIRDLQYLIAISEHRHFSKAADACFVSQPALSMQIKKLENSLGIKLIERTNKSVLLTEAGINIANRARHILKQIDEMKDFAQSTKDPYSGEIKIGIIPTLAPYLLPLIIPPLIKKLPKLSFYLIEEKTDSLVGKLKDGTLDAAFLVQPITEHSLEHAPLFKEEFLLATPTQHPLSKKKTIKQTDLASQTVLLLEEGHCMREQTLSFCQQMNANEVKNFRATSLETLRHMVAAGNGITLMPVLASQTKDHLAYIPFSSPKPERTIALYWRTSTAKKLLLQTLTELTKSILIKQKSLIIV